jgi:uncharacterized protein YkwD
MFSITRAGHSRVLIIVPILAVLTFNAIIPDIFAQTPSAAPAAALSRPTEASLHSRLRRVSGSTSGNLELWPAAASDIEKRAFELTNAAREEKGLISLTWDANLCHMARMHSESMARLGFFSHETPEGLRMRDRARALGIVHFQILGENISYNQGHEDPAGFAVEEWLQSPGHRANIFRDGFRQSAIGVFIATDGTVYLTQEFMAR